MTTTLDPLAPEYVPPSPAGPSTAVISPPEEERLRAVAWRAEDVIRLVGSAVAAVATTWLVWYRLTALEGTTAYFLVTYLVFLLVYWRTTSAVTTRLQARDRLMEVVLWSTGVVMAVPLVMILGYVVSKGIGTLRPSFFTEDQRFFSSLGDGAAGGGGHAVIGTLEQVGIAMVISVPLGVATAVFLNEIGGRLARPVRIVVDAMSALPSVVAGLFVLAFWILQLGFQASGLAAGLALAVIMLPTVTRTAEVVLRLVPGGLREASLALGATQWSTVRKVVLPTARSGLFTAVLLGVARVVGETAPLLLVAGGARVFKFDPLAANQEALPLFVFNLYQLPNQAQIDRAWTGALVLILLVLVAFTSARLVASRDLTKKAR